MEGINAVGADEPKVFRMKGLRSRSHDRKILASDPQEGKREVRLLLSMSRSD